MIEPTQTSRRLVLFVGGVFAAESAFFAVVPPLVPQLVHDVHLTTIEVGILVAAYPAGVLWVLRQAGYPVGGASVLLDGDLPWGAGLSSSAAVECALHPASAVTLVPPGASVSGRDQEPS